MDFLIFLELSLVFIEGLVTGALSNSNETSKRYFPNNFMFGYASAAYQVEGAWSVDGKGENIWDWDAHNTNRFHDGENGDIGPDGYHHTDDDVALLVNQRIQAYRLSIAWSRILPNGTIDNINQKGLYYYKDLIKKLKDNNIEPLVTMHHWDIPQALEEKGGFLNGTMIIPAFLDYATLLYKEFGSMIKYWITFNEPKQTCAGGYDSGGFAPQHLHPGTGGYLCSYNLLRAHAKAYRIYDKRFRASQKGLVSMVADSAWIEPASNEKSDTEAAERVLQFNYGWFINPIVNGEWPEVMKKRILERSSKEGFNQSRLPAFTDDEKAELKNTYDFLTINMYTTSMAKAIEDRPIGKPSLDDDISVSLYQDESWEKTAAGWFRVVPWGARKLVTWIRDRFGDAKGIIVTENGYADTGSTISDMDTRGRFHRDYLSNINDAIHIDAVNVTGYMAWSLINDVEWYSGWSISNMGHFHVDFNSPNKTSVPKDSATYYRKVATTKCLVDVCIN